MSELEPDRDTLQAWIDAFSRFALDHIDGLPEAPAAGPLGAAGAAVGEAVSRPIAEEPLAGGVTEIIDVLRRATEASLCSPGPGFFAYIPGGGLPTAAVADLVSNLINRFSGHSGAAPALCRLEADVLEWLAHEFGYDAEARGLLTSGGSMANLSAVVTARHSMLGDEGDFRRSVVYASSQSHHSVIKSLAVAGIPRRNLRCVPVDAQLRLDPAALREMVPRDRADGWSPFLVVSAAGTTNTGAIDPLDEIANICEEESLWHHVDGAYGGAFALSATGRGRLHGIGRADSITFDPHKGMFLPYGTGCLLVRRGELLRRAHEASAAYMQDFDAEDRTGEPPSPAEYGPELSRDFRGLRLWLPLMLHGAGAFRRALDEKLELTASFTRRLQAEIDGGLAVEIVTPPELTIVAFRLRRRDSEDLAAWNARNAAFLAAINGGKRVQLSSSALPVADGDAFTLRVCILSFRTHANRVDTCLQEVVTTALRYTGGAS